MGNRWGVDNVAVDRVIRAIYTFRFRLHGKKKIANYLWGVVAG
jgi:hypothetical protein